MTRDTYGLAARLARHFGVEQETLELARPETAGVVLAWLDGECRTREWTWSVKSVKEGVRIRIQRGVGEPLSITATHIGVGAAMLLLEVTS